MELLDIGIQSRVIIGISAMLLLFISFLIVFVSTSGKKYSIIKICKQCKKNVSDFCSDQNMMLEQRVNGKNG